MRILNVVTYYSVYNVIRIEFCQSLYPLRDTHTVNVILLVYCADAYAGISHIFVSYLSKLLHIKVKNSTIIPLDMKKEFIKNVLYNSTKNSTSSVFEKNLQFRKRSGH